ncbi:MAG: hypothetical protein LBQ54_13665 [Planctomycetaceae bacterium]|nr:hypothetical protein [Planctomycetaceae bacterium]
MPPAGRGSRCCRKKTAPETKTASSTAKKSPRYEEFADMYRPSSCPNRTPPAFPGGKSDAKSRGLGIHNRASGGKDVKLKFSFTFQC